MSKVLVAAVKEAQGLGSSDDEEERPVKKSRTGSSDLEKKMKVLIAKAGKAHNVLMIRGEIGPVKNADSGSVNEYGPACIDVNLLVNGGGPHQENEVALDNCAKVTASNQRGDFLSLDTSTAAKKSARIVGVGGEAVCGGRGIFMVVLKHNKHGTWVLIDPDAIYLEKLTDNDPALRCVSANKIEDLGMVISKSLGNNGVSTVLRDLRSQLEVPVTRTDGITTLGTVDRDIRNHKKNRALFKAISLIKDGKHCPVFKLQNLTQSIETARFRQPFVNSPETFDLRVGNPFAKDYGVGMRSPLLPLAVHGKDSDSLSRTTTRLLKTRNFFCDAT